MYSSLSKIDVVARQADGRELFVQTDHRMRDEIERDRNVSVVFAAVRLRRPLREAGPGSAAPVVVYAALGEVPSFLQEVIAAAGARLEVEQHEVPFTGTARPLDELFGEALAGLAAEMALAREMPMKDALLEVMELELEDAPPDVDVDENAYWRAVVSLGAVAGELLRSTAGGRWDGGNRPGAVPFVMLCAEMEVNLFGKAIKFLADPIEGGDSLLSLVQFVRNRAESR